MRTMMGVVLAALVPPLAAQEQSRPAEWKVRFDRPDAPDSALFFVTMTPGWHITTGPAGILYDPARRGSGNYMVESETFLFPGERLEGFGLFFGGRDLEGAEQAYSYFLVRKDGKFLVKRRTGSTTSELVPWTEHAAIVKQEGDGQAKNVLAVDVGPREVVFLVNGRAVATLPRDGLDTDGIAGLRVNHRLNLHVTRLDVTAR